MMICTFPPIGVTVGIGESPLCREGTGLANTAAACIPAPLILVTAAALRDGLNARRQRRLYHRRRQRYGP